MYCVHTHERERESDLIDEVMSGGETSPTSTDDDHLLSPRDFMRRGEIGPEKEAATTAIDGGRSWEASRMRTAGS